MSRYGSAESIRGWGQSYLGLGKWPERIREAVNSTNRLRDELDFYMCFFVHAFSLRDWMIKQGAMAPAEIDLAISSHYEMRLCRDICNRYKHLEITKPSEDRHWSIGRYHDPWENGWHWAVFTGDRKTDLWDLMMKCLSFWEALVAAYGLDAEDEFYWREAPETE